MRNKVVVCSAAPRSLSVMVQDIKWLSYSYLWTFVFQTMYIRKTFKWAKFTLILSGTHKCLAHCKMFQAWLTFKCLKRELERGHWTLSTLLHLLTTFKFSGWTYLSLTCDATSFFNIALKLLDRISCPKPREPRQMTNMLQISFLIWNINRLPLVLYKTAVRNTQPFQ